MWTCRTIDWAADKNMIPSFIVPRRSAERELAAFRVVSNHHWMSKHGQLTRYTAGKKTLSIWVECWDHTNPNVLQWSHNCFLSNSFSSSSITYNFSITEQYAKYFLFFIIWVIVFPILCLCKEQRKMKQKKEKGQ